MRGAILVSYNTPFYLAILRVNETLKRMEIGFGEEVDLLQLSLYVLLSELSCHRRGIPKPGAGERANERYQRGFVVKGRYLSYCRIQ